MRFFLLLLLILPTITLAEPLRIFTSVSPLKTLIEQIGGPHVDVQALVGPGFNPHTYEPTPQQITTLSKADLYIRIGMPFEQAWLPRLSTANTRMQVLDAYPDVARSDHTHNAHDHAFDPHVWTSPLIAKKIAARIQAKLTELAPQHNVNFRRNHTNLARALDQLHQDIHTLLAPFSGRQFLVFHPAWGHFAEAYDLTQIAIEHAGQETGIRTLANTIQQARQANIRVIFAQPQFDQRFAAQVARAIDGKVVLADPLAADYSNNLRRVAAEMARTFDP